MSGLQRSIIVKNTVELTGNKDYVDEALVALKNEEGKVDFGRIIPVYSDPEDLPMDKYLNDALNVWLEKNESEVNVKEYVRAFIFAGLTRENSYNFKRLTENEINVAKSKNQVNKLLKDAQKFIDSLKKKSIFNGYFAREGAWGTGTQPIDQVVKGNRLTYDSINTPALKVFEKLSTMFPNIKVVYTYQYEFKDENSKIKKEINQVTFRNGELKVVKQDTRALENSFSLIKQNVAV